MKRSKNLILLLIVLAAVIVVYIVASAAAKREEKENEVPEETKISIVEKESSEVSSFEYTSQSTSFTIELSSSTYYLKDDHNFPLDQTIASSMAEAVALIECDRVVAESCDDLSEYGLDDPLYVINASYSDGASVSLNIGTYNKHTDSYYVTVDGTAKVYLIDAAITDSFDYTINQLLKDESVTEPEDGIDAVTDIEVVFADGSGYKYTFVPGKDAETDEEGNETSEAVEDTWTKTLADGTVTDGDFTENAESLYDEIFSASLVDWADYHVTEAEQLEKYGLSEPYATVTVYYIETVTVSADDSSSSVTKEIEKSVSVFFGDLLPDGENPEDSSDDEGESAADTAETTADTDTADTAENSESEDTDAEENDAERYFLIGGGKVVYIVAEADFEEMFSGGKNF